MENTAPGSSDPVRTADLSDLPAGYQQVMSPSGEAAQVTGPRSEERQRPNGINPQAGHSVATEPDYERAFRATGSGEANHTGSGARGASDTSGAAGRPTGGGDAEGGAGGTGQRGIQSSGRRMSRTGTEMFRSPVVSGDSERMDGPLFPHAGQTMMTSRPGSDRGGFMWPSPLPSPTTRSINGDEEGQMTSGNVIAQQGAAAMKWLSRLGGFVQRRVSQQNRPGEQTMVLQESVWTPTRNQGRERSEEEPLFTREQNRRFQEMSERHVRTAPQLYGTMPGATGGGSDSSRSFTKEQLEVEVKRQVDQAMEEQKQINEENQRLKMEVERLRGEMAKSQGVPGDFVSALPLMDRALSKDHQFYENTGQVGGHLEGNRAGLPGHVREQGGVDVLQGRGADLSSNPGGLWGRDGERVSDRALGLHGVPQGNPPGLFEHGPLPTEKDQGLPEPSSVPGSNPGGLPGHDVRWGGAASSGHGGLGANLPGLPGHVREQGGPTRARSQSPQRSNFLGFAGRFGGSEGDPSARRHGQAQSVGNEGNAGGQEGLQRPSGFGGNLAGLPGHVREQGGHLFKNLPGIYSGPSENKPGIYSGPPPGLSGGQSGDPGAHGDAWRPGPEQRRGGGESPLEALVQGMTQLQAAMAMQLDLNAAKPEAIRPGTTASELPKLSEADEMAAWGTGCMG